MVGTLSPRASAGAERKEPWPLTGFSVSRWTAAFIEMPGYRSQMRCPAEPGLVKKISKPGLSPLGKPTEPTCLSIETAHTHTPRKRQPQMHSRNLSVMHRPITLNSLNFKPSERLGVADERWRNPRARRDPRCLAERHTFQDESMMRSHRGHQVKIAVGSTSILTIV